MAKYKIQPAPTFTVPVPFPVPGQPSKDVALTFKHRTKSELEEFDKSRAGRNDVESFMAMVVGWELDEEFTEANVGLLLENAIGVAVATYLVYVDELVKHKAKN